MVDRLDDQLFDGLLLEEIELLSEVIIAATASPDHLSAVQIDELLGVVPRRRGVGAWMNPSSSRDIPPGPFVPVPIEATDESRFEPQAGRNPLWLARAWAESLTDNRDQACRWTTDPNAWEDLANIDKLLTGRGLSNVVRHSPDDERVAYCFFVDIDGIDVFDDDTEAVAVTSATLVPAVIMTLVQVPDETWRVYSVGADYGKPEFDWQLSPPGK